jgi:hypothetical protein
MSRSIKRNRRNRQHSMATDALARMQHQLNVEREHAVRLSVYDMPTTVFAVLDHALPSWPAIRWAELARLLQQHALH